MQRNTEEGDGAAVHDEHRGTRYLQRWYAAHCDGEWEHECGIRMATTDNPGWHVGVDVSGTELEGVRHPRERRELPGGGWVIAWSDGEVFQAACAPGSLGEVDALFERWAESAARDGG
ncbi:MULTISPECIES: Imm53 family immunity protein [Streptomyces]|uniref:Imm53 family immunity protein n=1 Tax=Streptomyces TaxID=1883 RepID=UPI00296E9C60|nr:Imm53 family immunity protein [Streptomyces californicus]MDW4896915.1 Imm53 family immunity protein [Streptomyces californicus]